ncbi:MAG: OmpH family outer membrane protein [Candidatus Firestonebacteria bacterium]
MKKLMFVFAMFVATACLGQQQPVLAIPEGQPAPLAGGPVMAGAAGKIAVIDLKAAFDGYSKTGEQKSKLEKEVDAEKQALKNLQEEVNKMLKDYYANKSLMNPAKTQEEENKIITKQQELTKKLKESENKLQGRELELTQGILEEIIRAVGAVYKEEGYGYVFDKKSLLFGGEDITAKVKAKLEKK